MIIKTERLTIRFVKKEDWTAIRNIWIDFSKSEHSCYDIPHCTEDTDVRERIARWDTDNQGQEHNFFAICCDNEVIGYISLNQRENGYEIGYCFHSRYHHKGYAKESLTAIITYAKKQGIRRLVAGTAIKNIPSVNLLLSVGFVKSGEEKVSFYKNILGEDIYFDGGIFELIL